VSKHVRPLGPKLDRFGDDPQKRHTRRDLDALRRALPPEERMEPAEVEGRSAVLKKVDDIVEIARARALVEHPSLLGKQFVDRICEDRDTLG
jgi:hypothetical protein